jgi:hypothetical protein
MLRGIDGQNLSHQQPVEQHAHGRKVLLDRGLGGRCLQRLYIGSDVNGLDIGKLTDPVPLDPGKERTRSPVIGHARVPIADRCRKELDEPSRGPIASTGDHRRHGKQGGRRSDHPRARFWHQCIHAG